MKTPLSVLLWAVFSWIALYAALLVPQFSKSYTINLIWMTLVTPNLMRYAVGMIPQLAIDRGFFFASTLVSFILVYIINQRWSDTKEAVKNSKASNDKKLKLSILLSGTFAVGALGAYFVGMDKSIYSNMGWERNSSF